VEIRKEGVFFVVPAYNEVPVLASTLEPLIRAGYPVVVVDDGSTDGSWEILEPLPVYALRHHINLGQGAALQTGTIFALSKGAEVIIHFDADGQHQLEDVSGLLEPVLSGEADVALGSRFMRHDDKKEVPLSKRALLKMAIILNGAMTGLWLTDAHNGLRVLNRRAAEGIDLLENGYAHASEILNQIRRLQLRCVERPVRVHYSKYARSKGQSKWNAVNILLDLFSGRFLK